MDYNIAHYAKNRYTAKAYDAKKKISDEHVAQIKDLLRYSASSTNSQPWHFVLASTDEGKARIANAIEEKYPFNVASIKNASHVVVFCSKLDIDEPYLLRVLEQEEKDGRYKADPEALKNRVHGVRNFFIDMHKHDYKDVQHWMDKQVYLNIGAFLLGVSTMGIDATPMEGIDVKGIDEEFGLREKGYTSLVVVCLGYHDDENDFNAALPKSRLPLSEILTEV